MCKVILVFHVIVFAFPVLQKLWLDIFDAFLVTNNFMFGLSDNNTPETVAGKQQQLRVPSTSVIYHNRDGTIKSVPPHGRPKALLGQFVNPEGDVPMTP